MRFHPQEPPEKLGLSFSSLASRYSLSWSLARACLLTLLPTPAEPKPLESTAHPTAVSWAGINELHRRTFATAQARGCAQLCLHLHYPGHSPTFGSFANSS